MRQSRFSSGLETTANVAVGFVVSYIGTAFLLPAIFQVEVGKGQSFGIVLMYTALSASRSYLIRRLFDWLEYRKWKAAQKRGFRYHDHN